MLFDALVVVVVDDDDVRARFGAAFGEVSDRIAEGDNAVTTACQCDHHEKLHIEKPYSQHFIPITH